VGGVEVTGFGGGCPRQDGCALSANDNPTVQPSILPAPAESTRFILLHTSHGGNVGAAARAMKVMGFSDLVLVQPRFSDVLVREETLAMASGAVDVLERARIVPDLGDALDGITWACATAMTPRDFGPPTLAPRAHLSQLAQGTHRVAFVFGAERTGMSNAEVYRCHMCLSIPTHPEYGSLNLAQAVQVMAYEWRQALGGFAVEPRTLDPLRADAKAVEGALAHWQAVLQDLGFLDTAAPKKLMPRLNQLLNRLDLSADEVHILRGMARAVAERASRNRTQ
jgi:tRNA/rRNA methyltransferase